MWLRKVNNADIEDVMQIFSQARMAQRNAGFRQWEDGYPSIEVLKADIDNNIGYVVEDEDTLVGYIAITTFDEEYERFQQLWADKGMYAVFHRIAISDAYRGKGLSKIIFDLAEELSRQLGVESIRIDTGIENRPMQHILSKRNYTYLGTCDFVWGARFVYEKPLQRPQ